MSTYVEKRSLDLQKPIVDAREPLAIEVKPVDIVRASDNNSKCCAYVRACERELAGCQAAFFFRSVAYIEHDDKIVRYALPQSVQKEIVSFDRHRTMEPGVYQLSAPSPSRGPKARKKAEKRKGRHGDHEDGPGKSGRRVIVHRTTGVRSLNEPTYWSRP